MIRGSGGWELLGWIVSFTIITTIFVLLRFWSARIQKREFYLDDSCVIIAYVSVFNGAQFREPALYQKKKKRKSLTPCVFFFFRVHRLPCWRSRVSASGAS